MRAFPLHSDRRVVDEHGRELVLNAHQRTNPISSGAYQYVPELIAAIGHSSRATTHGAAIPLDQYRRRDPQQPWQATSHFKNAALGRRDVVSCNERLLLRLARRLSQSGGTEWRRVPVAKLETGTGSRVVSRSGLTGASPVGRRLFERIEAAVVASQPSVATGWGGPVPARSPADFP